MWTEEPLTDTEIASRIRAANRCQICRQPRRTASRLCDDHHDELSRMLDPDYYGDRDLERAASIPVLWAMLDPTPARAGLQPGRPPGFWSAPPLNVDHLVMRDARSVGWPVVEVWYELLPGTNTVNVAAPHYEDESPARSVPKAIAGIADAVWDELGYGEFWDRLGFPGPPPARSVEAHSRWLHAHLDHLTAREDAAEVFDDVQELHSQLRPAAGDPKPAPVADCTGWVRDPHTREKVECGAPLYLPPPRPLEPGQPPPKIDPKKAVLRCQRCDRPYTHLMLLRQEIGAEKVA